MNYVQWGRDPRRRVAVIAAVLALHAVMITGWFNLKLYGNPHRQPLLVRVDIVHDVKRPPHPIAPNNRTGYKAPRPKADDAPPQVRHLPAGG